MSLYPKFRDVHLWVGLILLMPLLVIAVTGFILNHEDALGLKPKKYQEKKPGERQQKRQMASIDTHAIAPPVEEPSAAPLHVHDWSTHEASVSSAVDVAAKRWGKNVPLEKVELKQEPGYGLIVKVLSSKTAGVKPREFIIAAHNGEILEEKEEGGNWIKDLHTGELFHRQWGVLFSDTSALALLALSVTGIVLYAIPVLKKRQKKAKAKPKPMEKAVPSKPGSDVS